MDPARPNTWPKFVRYRGSNKRLRFTLVDDLGGALTIAEHTLLFSVKGETGSLIEKSSEVGGFTTIDGEAGEIEVQLLPADDEQLTPGTVYPGVVVAENIETGARHYGRFTLTLVDGLVDEPVLTIPTTVVQPPGLTWIQVPTPLPEDQILSNNGEVLVWKPGGAGDMLKADNLAGLADVGEARDNLGLGSSAVLDVPASGNAAAGEVVKGSDTRLTDSRTPSGGAGGVLSGNFPNPGFAVDMATQEELTNGLAAKAPLESPALTGTPTAPTAATVTSNTQISTTAFVHAVVAALINSAPGALDTLEELAEALGDDPNFATTIANALAGKLAKASNLSDLTDVAAARVALGLVIGTNVQAFAANLTALANLVGAADRLPYFTGSGALSLATFTAAARSLLDDADTAAMRTTLGAAASTETATLHAAQASKAPRPGIISAGTSAVGTTRDNTGLPFGTGDLTPGIWAQAVDWTPSSIKYLGAKYASSLGVELYLNTNGTISVTISGTTYTSTVATGLTDGAWAFIAWPFDRDGNLTFYVNGVALGSTRDISAQSAVSMSNTGALVWGASTGGTGQWVGAIGECWIVAGLLTSTQIANIYAAGSIAPFCTFTANATTGQDVATIGGLSFYQWADFGQGYGPVIRDRSGNNQHAVMGTTGLTHAVPRSPRGNPSRAPRTALAFSGLASSFVRATLNAQNPGSGDCAFVWDGVLPTSNTEIYVLSGCSSNTTSVLREQIFALVLAGNSLTLDLRGSGSSSDSRTRSLSSATTLFGGKRILLVGARSAAGPKLFIGVDGEFFDATNLTTESTSGTPPAWTDTIVGTYQHTNTGNSNVSLAGLVYDSRLLNVVPTEAQLRTEYERGEPGPEWTGATRTVKYTSDFSAGADSWSGVSSTTVTGNTDGIGAVDNTLKLEAAATSLIATRTQALEANRRYRIKADVYRPAANVTATKVEFMQQAGSAIDTTVAASSTTADTWVSLDVLVLTRAEVTSLRLTGVTTGGSQTVTLGDILYFKNVSIEQVGYTTRLRTDTASALGALNGAVSTTNDSTDFTFSAAGVTPAGTDPRITAISQNSQSAAYTLLATDAGKLLYHPSADTSARTWTIPANASVPFPIGTAISFFNDSSAGVITISITTDTLVLAGAGTTGSRTLAANGFATAVKVTATRWVINGTGLT